MVELAGAILEKDPNLIRGKLNLPKRGYWNVCPECGKTKDWSANYD